MEVLKTGITPILNEEEWVSEEVPFSKEEIDRVFPGRGATFPVSAWFLKQTGQSYLFTFETACMINRVKMSEAKEAIVVADALKSIKSKAKLS